MVLWSPWFLYCIIKLSLIHIHRQSKIAHIVQNVFGFSKDPVATNWKICSFFVEFENIAVCAHKWLFLLIEL